MKLNNYFCWNFVKSCYVVKPAQSKIACSKTYTKPSGQFGSVLNGPNFRKNKKLINDSGWNFTKCCYVVKPPQRKSARSKTHTKASDQFGLVLNKSKEALFFQAVAYSSRPYSSNNVQTIGLASGPRFGEGFLIFRGGYPIML